MRDMISMKCKVRVDDDSKYSILSYDNDKWKGDD